MVKNFLDKIKDRFSKKKDSSDETHPKNQTKDGENLSLDKLPLALQKALQQKPDQTISPPQKIETDEHFNYQEIKTSVEVQPDEEIQKTPTEPSSEQSLSSTTNQTQTTWFGKLNNKFNLKMNTISWHLSRDKGDTSTSFRLPTTQRLRFEEISLIFFSPKNRSLVHRIFLISLAIAVPYTAGKMLALFLHPSLDDTVSKSHPTQMELSNSQNYKEQMDRIRMVNLFNAASSESLGTKRGPFICEKSDKRTSLPIKLVNTIVLQDSIKSIAAVQFRGSMDALTLREGDPVENVAEISKIERTRILIKNKDNGECEYAENEDKIRDQIMNRRFNILTPSAGRKLMASKANEGIRNVGNHFFIKKALREEAVKDMNNILTQARALQIRNPDGSYSFKMTEIIPGSVYSKLNVHDGDVISAINGKKIENINELMNMFGKIKDIDNMSLTLTREGQEQTLEYEFE